MKTWEPIILIGVGVVATYVVTMTLRDWRRKRRAIASLAVRLQHDDEQFGRAYFGDAKRADIAVRARRVLSKNLKMPLNGLTPSDRLNEDLNAELVLDPDLFWELEAEFGIKTGIDDDMEAFEKTLERLVTFQDLVEFLHARMSEPPPQTSRAEEEEKPSRAYEWGIRSIPVLCIGGFLMAVAGIIAQKRSVMNLGAMIFLSGIAIWGLANGGELLRQMVQSIRQGSLKEIGARPLPFVFLTCLALFFLFLGSMFLWIIFKKVLSPK
jgi:hypothetical protein